MKINVLLNYYNFDGDWAKPHLEKYLCGKQKIVILPLAYRHYEVFDNASFLSLYGKGGSKYTNIITPFLAYGIAEDQIQWINPFDDEQDRLQMVSNADVLFFTGGLPEKAIRRLAQLGLTDAVKKHNFVMGASAGAMLQLKDYHVTPDDDYPNFGYWLGLGLVCGFDLEVHYLATDVQKQCTLQACEHYKMPIYQMWHEGGLLVVDGKITIMGNVEVVQ